MGRSVAFVTLGCKLNYSETSTFLREFIENGYQVVPSSAIADVYVVNTCSVTENSDKKSRNIIRRLHRKNANAIIAVTGCYAQLKPDEVLAIEGVSIVLGAQQKSSLFKEVSRLSSNSEPKAMTCDYVNIEDVFPAYSGGERTRSFLKVQDGCDYHCTYCTVPLARGKSRNLPISVLVDQARKIADSGVREIILTGVNTGDYGKSTGESFLSLLKGLNMVDGIERYRISSIEPNLLTQEIVDWIASGIDGGNKFLPHFHIPLQSGSDRVLALMKRRYSTSIFREKISMIRSRMSNVFFGIDVIVGFPGESDECFKETCDFLREVKPAFIHVFPYSKRSNTPAAQMDGHVSEKIKDERVKVLEAISSELYSEFYHSNIGREDSVLVESRQKDGMMFGYTRNYLKVELPFDPGMIGKIVKVKI